MRQRLHHHLLGMGLAQALALVAAGAASLLYARWLDAPDFALWTGALAAARAGLMLLDGGLKTALVRRAVEADAITARRLQRWVALAAAVLAGGLALLLALLWQQGRLAWPQCVLIWGYVAAYVLLYPPLFGPLARLERAQRFGPVARAEAASVALEFAAPLPLLLAGLPAWAAFVLAAWLARGWRSLWIAVAAAALPPQPAAAGAATGSAALLREGLGVQAVALLSMLRDHLHLLLVAPWFGAEWAGRYAFAFTACTLVSQVFVQTSARIALPVLRGALPAERWALTLVQVRQLAIATLPPLALLPALLAQADQTLWQGRWAEAVALLPWLVWRMLPSVATTALGGLLLVGLDPWETARVHARWTLLELLAAALALWWLGPVGLALSAAAMAWAGLALFAERVAPRGWAVPLLQTLLLRPSLWVAAALGAVAWSTLAPGLALCALPLAWLAEPGVRRWLRSLHAAPRGAV